MKNRPRPGEQLAKAVRWNKTTPPGTAVRYHPIRDDANAETVVTDSEAYMLSGHTADAVIELLAAASVRARDVAKNWQSTLYPPKIVKNKRKAKASQPERTNSL